MRGLIRAWSPRSRILSIGLLTVLGCGACERIVGIHSSAVGDGSAADGHADTTADLAADVASDAKDAKDAKGDGAGNHDTAADAPVDQHAGDAVASDGGADGAAPSIDSSSDVSGDSSVIDSNGGNTDTSGGDTGASDGPGLMCPPDPSVATPIHATAYLYTSGPNDTKNSKSACSFMSAQLPTGTGLYYGAVNKKLLASAARCGSCMHVAATGGGAVDVRIVDVVSDLSTTGETISIDSMAKAILAVPQSNPDVTVSFVPCVVGTSTIQISFAGDTDPAVLVMNYNNQVASVQFVGTTGNVNLTRQPYNRWTPPSTFSFGGGNITLQLTDVFGNVIQTDPLKVSTELVDTHMQFPTCAP